MHDAVAQTESGLIERISRSRWVVVAILCAGAGLSLLRVGDWSLWQDEETSIYFSQQHTEAFPRTFPVYFEVLRAIFQVTGISVEAGRLLSASFGLLCVLLTYRFAMRHLGSIAALVAGVLLTLCIDQLFWSQTIRYYTMVAFVQICALTWFYEGFEESSTWKIIAAGVLATVAMFVHFTAVLLVPVFVTYILAVFVFRQKTAAFSWQNLLAVGIPIGVGICWLLPKNMALQKTGALGPPPEFQSPISFLLRIGAYYGVPMIALGIAVLPSRRNLSRATLLVLCWAGLPLLELITLGMLRRANVCWYHGLVAMYGWGVLAGIGFERVYRAGWRRMAAAIAFVSILYYGAFAVQYYTVMQGNRPPWREGAECLRQATPINPAAKSGNPELFCTVPSILAYYLGVPPNATGKQHLVKEVPEHPVPPTGGGSQWYVVTQDHVTAEYDTWFTKHCDLLGRFPAKTVFIDRSVLVYRYPAMQKTP